MYFEEDDRFKKVSFGRRLVILKDKIENYRNVKKKKYRRQSYDAPRPLSSIIFSFDHLEAGLNEDKKSSETRISLKQQNFVKLFIENLKHNSFNSIHNNQIDMERLNKFSQKIDEIANVKPKGPKGWKAPIIFKLIITIMTFFTILSTHLLTSFQFLFQDYREQYSNDRQATAYKYGLLVSIILRMLSKIFFVKINLGEKIEHIGAIVYFYVTHLQFYMDLLILMTIILLLALPNSTAVGVFGFFAITLNIIYFQQMNKVIDFFIRSNNVKKQLFALFKLLLSNLFVSHIVASLLITVTTVQYGKNWMDKYGIIDQVWWVKYSYGFYYAAAIVFTVGFGDITVSSVSQAILVAFVVLFGCIILSYNISKVANIIQSLSSVPQKVRNQLSLLDRLVTVTQIDENLHHTIGQYIIHVGEIKKSFEVDERHELIQMLPSQLKQEFLEQSSKNFCAKLPFFFMLQTQTKKRICQKLKMQVLSPNQYITHKRLGLKKIVILRKGVVGFAYKKKGSNLNGKIVQTISIKSEVQRPQLLNTYLLVRGRRLLYDIICQKYCIVSQLSFEDFLSSLKESELDYENYHQTYDEAIVRTNEWSRHKCQYCNFKHSLFVCPKIHYAPLRSIVFLRYQRSMGKKQFHANMTFIRQKIWYSRLSPLKFKRKIFKAFEKVFNTNIQKNQILRLKSVDSKHRARDQQEKWREFENILLTRQYLNSFTFNVDISHSFKYYFSKDNPNSLIEKSLAKNNKNILHLEKFQERQ